MRRKRTLGQVVTGAAAGVVLTTLCGGMAHGAGEPLSSDCVVSVLNRTARVDADGTWVVPNVPSGQGAVRIRATCTAPDGSVTSGQSAPVVIPADGVIEVEGIAFDSPVAVPIRLVLSAAATILTASGQTLQLAATAPLPDGSSVDLSAPGLGTDYRSSNPDIASVDQGGVVTAHLSGAVLISAQNDGALGVLQLQVNLSGDSDGDGLADDWELANGFDPNNPVDALDDPDQDGLTTGQEFSRGTDARNPDSDGDGLLDGREANELGTNPVLGDTDGDGFWDGLEIQTVSDPLDPNSFNVAAAVRGISVSPAAFVLIFNTVFGDASRQLVVTGELIDGRTLDITDSRYGTTYISSNLTIANFGAEPGRVYAGQPGAAVVTARNGAFAVPATVTVESFSPTALSWVQVAGFANALDLAADGDYVYIAAGAAGIQVVDASNPLAPFVAGALDTPGNANDISVAGDFAYVADGAGGLFIADISTRSQPQLVASLATAEPVSGIAVRDGIVYLADRTGLRVVDATTPASPSLLGGLTLSGRPSGVDLEGELALVAAVSGGLHVVDVSELSQPTLLGSTATRFSGASGAIAVRSRGRFAWVADGGLLSLGGLRTLDLRIPGLPFLGGSSSDQYGLTAVQIAGRLALAADYFYRNAVPIFDIGTPTPQLRAVLDFRVAPSFRNDEGHDLEVRNGLVYMVGTCCFMGQATFQDDGVMADSSALHIGRYAQVEEEPQPDPPAYALPLVAITEPADQSFVLEGRVLRIRARAADDVRVESVDLLVNGQVVETDFAAPYEFEMVAPGGISELHLTAAATDTAGNRAVTAAEVLVFVSPDGEPTVRFLRPTEGSRFLEGTSAYVVAEALDDRGVTAVAISLDGVAVPVQTITVPGFGIWHTAMVTVPSGVAEFTLTAIAEDAAGPSTPAQVTVQVQLDEPPQVVFLTPQPGVSVGQAATLPVTVGATDDFGVQSVRLYLDGALRDQLASPPYEVTIAFPDVGEHVLEAVVVDTRGQSAIAGLSVTVTGGDPLTAVTGAVGFAGAAVNGATVVCHGMSGMTGADGVFLIPGVPTLQGNIRCLARYTHLVEGELSAPWPPVPPVLGGTTDVGLIFLTPANGRLYPGAKVLAGGQSVEVADLDSDHRPDLVTAFAGANLVAVLMGTGDAEYEPTVYFQTGVNPRDVAVADLDGDGYSDLLTANHDSDDVSILFADGAGGFGPAASVPVGDGPVAIDIGDLDNDGIPDVVVANRLGNTVSVLLGTGAGGVNAGPTLVAAGNPIAVRLAEINGDGILDIALAAALSTEVAVYFGNGDGTFVSPAGVPLGALAHPVALAVGDLDDDGWNDLATASTSLDDVRVFFGEPGGSFTAGPVLAAGSDPSSVAIGQVAGVAGLNIDDSALDIVVANRGGAHVSLFHGVGLGSRAFLPEHRIRSGDAPADVVIALVRDFGGSDVVTANDWNDVSLLVDGAPSDIVYPVGASPNAVALGDVDGDGILDAVVANLVGNELSVLLEGGRLEGTRVPLPGEPYGLVLAHLDGDSALDVAVTASGTDEVVVLPGVGDGTLGAALRIGVGPHPTGIAAGDLDRDGADDLVVTNRDGGSISVLLGTGTGGFAPETRFATGAGPRSLVLADFDGDGTLDAATANFGTDDVSILRGSGSGGFLPETRVAVGTAALGPARPASIAAGDVDGDGDADLTVSLSEARDTSGRAWVAMLRGNGDGSFATESQVETRERPWGAILADANADGFLDLVVSHPLTSQDLTLHLGNGDGTFRQFQLYAVGRGAYALAAGDLNGDQAVDLVTANYDEGNVSVLLHRTFESTPGAAQARPRLRLRLP